MRITFTLMSRVGKFSTQYSNLPESYVKRAMKQVFWEAPKDLPQYLPVTVEKKKFRFGMNRPWTEEFKRENPPNQCRKKVFIEPIREWSFFRGDRVEILVGKDKGKIGLVAQIIQERNWVIVEGLNVHYKRIGQTEGYPGLMIQAEAPLLVTNEVALVDPSDNKGTKVEWRFTEQGERVRVSTRTGHIIPVPISATETIDYKTKSGYPEQDKDTLAPDVAQHTYVPQCKTFEMELVEHYKLE